MFYLVRNNRLAARGDERVVSDSWLKEERISIINMLPFVSNLYRQFRASISRRWNKHRRLPQYTGFVTSRNTKLFSQSPVKSLWQCLSQVFSRPRDYTTLFWYLTSILGSVARIRNLNHCFSSPISLCVSISSIGGVVSLSHSKTSPSSRGDPVQLYPAESNLLRSHFSQETF